MTSVTHRAFVVDYPKQVTLHSDIHLIPHEQRLNDVITSADVRREMSGVASTGGSLVVANLHTYSTIKIVDTTIIGWNGAGKIDDFAIINCTDQTA